MPVKKRITKRRFVKRRPKRMMRRRRPRIPRGPFPVSKIAKLKLSLPQLTNVCTSGALASVNVEANWPVYSGRYAFGWDQWTALYNQAICLGSKITVYQQGYVTGTVSADVIGLGGIYVSDDTTNYTDYQDLVEANKGKFMRIGMQVERVTKCKNYFSAKKFFNVKDVKDNTDHLGAAVTESTAINRCVYKIWAQPTDKSTTATYYYTGVVEYIMLFQEPKDVPGS